MKKIVTLMLALTILFSLSTLCFAAATKTIAVSATIPAVAQAMDVTISEVNATTNVFSNSSSSTPIAFGTLIYNPTLHIFLPDNKYFAVDIGVTDNSGSIWTLTHTRTNVANGGNNLNSNINVSFVKQTSSTAFTPLQKVTYGNSNSVQYNKTALAGGWLRIYYGIATGNTDPINGEVDATGASPITTSNLTGIYSGMVTITLAP